MNIAIIPARGGSKRIPKKNIKSFFGKPIISYSIDTAIKSGLFEKVIVSTDDPEISEIANEYGAQTPFIRPKNLSDDFSGTHEVIGHAVQYLESLKINMNYICCIYPTAPLIRVSDLIQGYKLISSNCWDSVIAATNYSYPIYRSFEYLESGGLRMLFPDHYTSRSQDLEEVYHDAGQFYWGRAKAFIDGDPIFSQRSCAVLLPRSRVQDIDTLEDWRTAEILFKAFK